MNRPAEQGSQPISVSDSLRTGATYDLRLKPEIAAWRGRRPAPGTTTVACLGTAEASAQAAGGRRPVRQRGD